MVVLIGNFPRCFRASCPYVEFLLMVTMDSRKEKQAKTVEQTWELFSIICAYIINKGGVV